MDQTTNYCPCCGRHCNLSAPHCPRGEEYARTGVIPEGGARKNPGEGAFSGHGKHSPEEEKRKTEHYRHQNVDNKLLLNLRELGHILRHRSEGKGSQERILMMLEELGPVAQRDLTRHLGIQPGSASEVLGKLESAGLIQRTPSQEDRRTTVIALTDTGKEKAAEAGAQRQQRLGSLFSCLTEEEKAALLPLLEKLNGAWRHQHKAEGHHQGGGPHGHGHGHHHGESHQGHEHHGPHHQHRGDDQDVEVY